MIGVKRNRTSWIPIRRANKYFFEVGFSQYPWFYMAAAIALLFVFTGCSEQPSSVNGEKKNTDSVLAAQVSLARDQNSPLVTDTEAFSQSLYPLLAQNCGGVCHGTDGVFPPLIAHTDMAIAYTETVNNQKVDLTNPAISRVVDKLRVEQHNCWSVCDDDANALQTAIEQWMALVRDVASGEALYQQKGCADCHGLEGAGTNGVPGLTRTLTVAELTTIIDQNMPPEPNDRATCAGPCAATVAQYIFDNFTLSNSELPITEPLADLPRGQTQLDILCTRLAANNQNNVVRDAFCGEIAPTITSLRGLQAVLGLEFTNPNATRRGQNGHHGNPAFTLTGHSSSLVGRFVSAINPRAIIFTAPNDRNPTPGLVAMGFVRGDQFAEIVTSDRITNELSFFLVEFKQTCNLDHSCTPGDLLTPAVESNWIEYSVFGEQDLQNTILDCLQCHQPAGPGTRSILRMQELRNPWTHFFRNNRESGRTLLVDYIAAHGLDEEYAGIPGRVIPASDPALLEDLVRGNGFTDQPNEFNSRKIENQVSQTPGQPENNDIPGASHAWQHIYEASVRGEAIGVPYHDAKVTDSVKLTEMSESYQAFLSGALAQNDLPDIRNVFLDSMLRDIGFKVKADLDGPGIVIQACTQCHHSALDQTITRARFNVALDRMSDTQGGVLTGAERDAEIGVTIARLRLPAEDVRKMPPEQFRTLEPAEIELVVAYLCSQTAGPIAQCSVQ